MPIRRFAPIFRIAAGLALSVAALSAVPHPGAAQGLFGFLFGQRPSYQDYPGYSRYPNYSGYPGARYNAYADPRFYDEDYGDRRGGSEYGIYASYCVRLCDGRYFPIVRGSGNPAQTCNALCPASETKVFSGSGIAHATASDGSRYSELGNAYVYRDRVVRDCTCNGKTPYGLAQIDVTDDPTLRNGDIVATTDGLLAYRAGRRNTGEFTPVDPARLTKDFRDNYANLKVEPAPEAAPNDPPPLRPGRQSRADAAAR